jgi:hypothetical protein
LTKIEVISYDELINQLQEYTDSRIKLQSE